MTRLLFLFAGAILACAASAANAVTVVATVDLDATSTVGQVETLVLGPGDYSVIPVAGTFTSWSAWSATSGCTTPSSCVTGWINAFGIDSAETGLLGSSDLRRYQTPELALDAAVPITFALTSTQAVTLDILDSPNDNRGGLSLEISVSDVPLPPAFAMLLSGLGGLAVIAQARRQGRRASTQ